MTLRMTISSFVNGEVSEDQLGFRSDWNGYPTALRRVENFLTTATGGLVKRGGWERLFQSDATRLLVPFEFNVEQMYLLAMGNSSCTVYRGDTMASVATFSIPWSDSQLPYIRWAGQGDTLVVTHPDVHPKTIKRGGSHSSWALADVSFSYEPFFSFYGEHDPAITLAASDNDGSITVTASAALFDSSWVGRRLEFNGGRMTITAVSNSTSASATVNEKLNRVGATTLWAQNAFSSTRGYPRTVTFYSGRLFFGGSKTLPATIWASRVGNYFDFNRASDLARNSDNIPISDSIPKTVDSDSLVFTVTSPRVATISDLVASKNSLGILSSSGEYVEASKPISPSSISFTQTSNVGMSQNGIRALTIDSEVLFISRSGDELRSFSYSLTNDSYLSENLSTINPTIISNPVDATAVRGLLPATTHAFFANANGAAAIMCIDATNKIRGWSRLNPATGCEIKNLTNLVDTNIYALIAYDGHRYVCRLSRDVYLDLFSSGTDTAKATWTGFSVFANKIVSVVGDGYVFSNVSVNGSGNFTLPVAVANVKVGLPYTAKAETLTLAPIVNGQLQRGRQQLRKIAAEVVVRDTADLWIDGKRIPDRKLGASLLNQPPAQRDTTVRQLLSGISREPYITLESRLPLSCSIIGLVAELKGPGLG